MQYCSLLEIISCWAGNSYEWAMRCSIFYTIDNDNSWNFQNSNERASYFNTIVYVQKWLLNEAKKRASYLKEKFIYKKEDALHFKIKPFKQISSLLEDFSL